MHVNSLANWSRAVYYMKSPGLYEFTVSATRQQFDITVNASLSINVLDQVFGLRLMTRQPYAVLHTDNIGSPSTDPVVFTARCSLLFLCLGLLYIIFPVSAGLSLRFPFRVSLFL